MASSRSPSPPLSPAPFNGGMPLLSPKSNMRQLLAGIDDSSDDDSTPHVQKRTSPKPNKAASPQPDQDSDDEDILRPRGRLAARMHADASTKPHSSPRKTVAPAAGAQSEDDDDDIMTRHLRRSRPSVQSREQTPTRDSSPDMFVTPSKGAPALPQQDAGSDSDADLPNEITKSRGYKNRLQELQQKRIARDTAEQKKKSRHDNESQPGSPDDMIVDDESDNITDDDGGRKLTQDAARPSARKASKKALEDMNRETQRLSRNLQLAHEAKIKKKITKASLFERFNFKPTGVTSEKAPAQGSSRPTSPVSAANPQSDADPKSAETPPSSPPTPTLPKADAADSAQPVVALVDDDEFPDLEIFVAQTSKKLDKGKGKATEEDLADETNPKPKPASRQFRVTLPATQANTVTLDSDDDELVVTKKSKLDAIFDSIPVRRKQGGGDAMNALRVLAQLGASPGKEGARRGGKFGPQKQSSMTAAQLQLTLHQRAREQARVERERRFEALRAKGVHIQTEEERERERQEVEDIVAAARREAEEIMLREKEETKAEKKKSGVVDPLAWDDSDEEDGDYADEEEAQPEEVELSGSEDDDADMASSDEEEAEDAEDTADGLVDEQAESAEESAEEASADELPSLAQKARRGKKQITVISDDEDDDAPVNNHTTSPISGPSAVQATPKPKASFFKSPSKQLDSPAAPMSVLRSATKTFIPGLPVKAGDAAGLSLSQIFAGTMDDSQADDDVAAGSPSQPRPTFDQQAHFMHASIPDDQDDLITSTQPTQPQEGEETQAGGVQLDFEQSQMHGLGSLLRDDYYTQPSQWMEPTQDEGFQNRSPLKQRFVDLPQSTEDTVAVDDGEGSQASDIPESPVARRGKLRRKVATIEEEGVAQNEAEDVEMAGAEEDFIPSTEEAGDAFSVMNEAAVREQRRKEKREARKKSEAKEMFQEQAEESEDEYAGLGGVDGEDSDDSGEDVKELIDDRTKASAADLAKIAALHADRERANDEKQVERLFRDITSGMLRRKRGADYGELSDEDDGGEARRRMKRRQFQKMQKALFADERVSKVAENPRTQAFMRTIEDRGSEDEDMVDILAPAEIEDPAAVPDSQSSATESERERPTAVAPSTRRVRKPATLGEVRESLSSLLEDHNSLVVPGTPGDESDSDADAEDNGGDKRPGSSSGGDKENRNPRRKRAADVEIVDRITLKRTSSSSSNSEAAGPGRRAAFAAGGSFKVPALLRRATTNSSMAATGTGVSASSTSSISTAAGPAATGEEAKVKKTAGKKSGVNYFARENERLAALKEKERRAEARKLKGAEGRGKVVAGLFSAGKFE